MNKYLLFICCSFFSSMTFAQELTCSLRGTQIHFVNGVNNTKDDVTNSIRAIKNHFSKEDLTRDLKHKLDKRSLVTFGSTYNRSFGFLEDFIESGAQTIHSKAKELGLNISVRASYHLMFQAALNLPSSYFPVLRRFASDLVIEANIRANDEAIDVKNIKDAFEIQLLSDKKLIIVSHSQGNLFTNRALEEMIADPEFDYARYEKVIGNIRFATPETKALAYHSSFLTNSKDFITVFGLRPWNYDLDIPPEEFDKRPSMDQYANHGFLETYLHNLADEYLITNPDLYLANLSLNKLRLRSWDEIENLAQSLDPHPRCPKAVINFTVDSSNPLNVILDSTDPEDPYINDLVYRWTFEDGTTEETTFKTIPRQYLQNGQYPVQLLVTTTDNVDFGPDAFAEKYITVGKTLARGCSGKAQGYYHTNPNGSTGGFVAETATVEATVHVGPSVSICGNSKVLGASYLSSDGPVMRYDGSEVWDSTISNTSIDVNSRLYIHTSALTNLNLTGDPWTARFVVATITDSIFTLPEFSDATVQYTTVTNSSITGYSFWIGYSTIASMNFEIDHKLEILGDQISYWPWSGPLSAWPFY